jgi:hypothetical protein
MGGYVGEMKHAQVYKILVWKLGGRDRLAELLRRKWEDNIKMDLKEIVCEDVDWIQLAQYRVQKRITVDTVTFWAP